MRRQPRCAPAHSVLSVRRPIAPVAASVLDTIGNTPVVSADRLLRRLRLSGRLLVKLEYMNPGLSKKDRVARELVEEARRSGELQPDQSVVELTSGNTGTGLAIVCAILGHPFIAVMSRGNSSERARMMTAFGAEVVLVDQADGSSPGRVSGADLALVEAETKRLVQERRAFRADQFSLAGSVLAHQRWTGPELWEAAEGRIDAFADFVGSSGSFTGVMRAFLESVLSEQKIIAAHYQHVDGTSFAAPIVASLVAQRRLTVPFIRDALERLALERLAGTESSRRTSRTPGRD